MKQTYIEQKGSVPKKRHHLVLSWRTPNVSSIRSTPSAGVAPQTTRIARGKSPNPEMICGFCVANPPTIDSIRCCCCHWTKSYDSSPKKSDIHNQVRGSRGGQYTLEGLDRINFSSSEMLTQNHAKATAPASALSNKNNRLLTNVFCRDGYVNRIYLTKL